MLTPFLWDRLEQWASGEPAGEDQRALEVCSLASELPCCLTSYQKKTSPKNIQDLLAFERPGHGWQVEMKVLVSGWGVVGKGRPQQEGRLMLKVSN